MEENGLGRMGALEARMSAVQAMLQELSAGQRQILAAVSGNGQQIAALAEEYDRKANVMWGG